MNTQDYRRDYLLHVMAGYEFPATLALWLQKQSILRTSRRG